MLMKEKAENENRRDFIKLGAAAGLGIALYPGLTLADQFLSRPLRLESEEADPHFFINMIFSGGLDFSYLYDGRPLELTQTGMKQNYLQEEPILLQDGKGGQTFASSLVKPLEKYLSSFSILNGVLMANGFEGHDQNMNYLFAGDPFGGEGFIPLLNGGTRARPIDVVQKGVLLTNLINDANTIPLSADSAHLLAEKLRKDDAFKMESPAFRFIRSRLEALGSKSGRLSTSAHQMHEGLGLSPRLADLLKKTRFTPIGDEHLDFLQMALELFRVGVTRSVNLSIDYLNLDTHGVQPAKNQPKVYRSVVSIIASLFKVLQETPFDNKQSFWDRTTVMVTSEFGRTFKQDGLPVDATGTDHNPFSNSILLGGRGIPAGRIMGASDFRSSTEKLSKAHLSADPKKLKSIGRPFDYATSRPIDVLHEVFEPKDYLTISSVINTVYSIFDVPKEKYRLVERMGAVAPVISFK